MSATGRDHKAIAAIIRKYTSLDPMYCYDAPTEVATLARELAEYFKVNPKFQPERFLRDCGVAVDAPTCEQCGAVLKFMGEMLMTAPPQKILRCPKVRSHTFIKVPA